MPHSALLDGVLAENAEAVRAQVWTFDHATVIGEIGRHIPRLTDQAARKLPFVEAARCFIPAMLSESAPSDPVRHARDDSLILPIAGADWRAAKLGRLFNHFDLRFRATPSEAELLDLSLEAETRAVGLLSRLAGTTRSKNGPTRFEGSTVTELARYVLCRMFEELSENFASKPPDEQERIAASIAKLLIDLPPEVQERIRQEAKLPDLSAAALRKTGAIAAVGGALIGTVGIAGFAAYTTLTSAIAASAGLFGVTLPFAVYLHATAAMAFLSNPLVLAAATLLGGRFALGRANRQIRDRLVPVMVATAVMASVATETVAGAPAEIVDALVRNSTIRKNADYRLRSQIDNTFQCLSRIA